jgi:hypothetical protein
MLSSLPVWEGTIIDEHRDPPKIPFYTVRRRLNSTELETIHTLAKGRYMELSITLRFGSPVIPKEETETQMEYWVDSAEILSFVEIDENGEIYYEVNGNIPELEK